MLKTFATVSELYSYLWPEGADAFEKDLKAHSIGRALFVRRNALGLTVCAVAEKLNKPTSWVTNLENSLDGLIRDEDLDLYLTALKGDMS